MVDGIVLPTLSRMMLLFHWGIILPLYCRLMENPQIPWFIRGFPIWGVHSTFRHTLFQALYHYGHYGSGLEAPQTFQSNRNHWMVKHPSVTGMMGMVSLFPMFSKRTLGYSKDLVGWMRLDTVGCNDGSMPSGCHQFRAEMLHWIPTEQSVDQWLRR